MQPLTAQFKAHLAAQGLSQSTLSNYVSDVELFLAWLCVSLQETTIQPIQLTGAVFHAYSLYLSQSGQNGREVNRSTAERYLSSLRRFGNWLARSGRLDADPAENLGTLKIDQTLGQVLAGFKNELKQQKLSASTIKNYISDVYNYLLWANKNIKITDNNSEILS